LRARNPRRCVSDRFDPLHWASRLEVSAEQKPFSLIVWELYLVLPAFEPPAPFAVAFEGQNSRRPIPDGQFLPPSIAEAPSQFPPTSFELVPSAE
jgi:hypothetical protein